MSHRTQITLTDAQYDRLKKESGRSGVGLAELVRRALVVAYGDVDRSSWEQGLEMSFGGWKDREFDGEEYVEHIRRGMARRLTE
ncbi:MAG: CopG family transcriptional regulator [Chloroflexota bacterium]|nr:MAG: hypothetical protein DLM70_11680 [Chloroflexota bacterium]